MGDTEHASNALLAKLARGEKVTTATICELIGTKDPRVAKGFADGVMKAHDLLTRGGQRIWRGPGSSYSLATSDPGRLIPGCDLLVAVETATVYYERNFRPLASPAWALLVAELAAEQGQYVSTIRLAAKSHLEPSGISGSAPSEARKVIVEVSGGARRIVKGPGGLRVSIEDRSS